jgi:hypothetical protein
MRRVLRMFAHRAISLFAGLLFASSGAAHASVVASTSRSVAGSKSDVSVAQAQVASVTESRSAKAAAWLVAFASSKPMHRVVRVGSTMEVHFQRTACPAVRNVRISSLAASNTASAAYISCSTSANDTVITFHVAKSQQIVLTPMGKSLGITIESMAVLPVRFARLNGTSVNARHFEQDALSRVSDLVQSNSRQNLQLLISANPGTAIARRAQAQLNNLPRLPQPVMLGQREFSTIVRGMTLSGTRVDLLARGGTESTSDILTRIYYYVYDPKSGVVVMSGNKLAPDALAAKYGFAPNTLQIKSMGIH